MQFYYLGIMIALTFFKKENSPLRFQLSFVEGNWLISSDLNNAGTLLTFTLTDN